MIPLQDRCLLELIRQAHHDGASLYKACEIAGITLRTLQRWQMADGSIRADARPEAQRPTPSHALSQAERAEVLRIANEPRLAEQPPARIVPALADEGRYVASESTFYRILRAQGQAAHRGRAKAPQAHRSPTTHVASGARQVWCWDMTYLPAQIAGHWFYLYLILDLYSRKIVGWEVHEQDDSQHAAHLVRRTALAEGIATRATKPVLHGDNGSTRPEFPTRGFADLQAARDWAAQFVRWYNHEHLHSGIRYVSPAARHEGRDQAILAARQQVYERARQRHPSRWSRHTRNWQPIGAVTLKPERHAVFEGAALHHDKQRWAV